MRQNKRLFLLISGFAIYGCAEAYSVSTDGGADGKSNPKTDNDNCGAAGNICIARDVDACFEGHCRCRTDYDCHLPDECREGICEASNAKGVTCRKDIDCAKREYCINNHCSPRTCLTEICDGFDNDCDGETDEAVETDVVCYTGPPSTRGIGACHAGKQTCEKGKYTDCENQFVPHAEVGRFSCDGEDSDCDGCTDGTGGATLGCQPATPPIVDFVVMMDNSGSMAGYINACRMATAFLSKFDGDARFQFSLMNVSNETVTGYLKVLQPLTDFATFKAALYAMSDYGEDTEPTYDAVYRTAKGDFDIEIGFRPGSLPVYIVFGDEPGQTVLVPPITQSDACKAVDARGVLLAIVTQPTVYPDWAMCAAKYSFPISTDPITMMMSLNSVLSLPCFNNP